MSNSTLKIFSNYSRPIIRLAMGLFIGGIGMGWAARGLDWSALPPIMATLSPLWLTLSVVGVIAVALAKAARWGAIYRATQSPAPFRQLFSVLVATQMVNLLIPIRLGELLRISLMKRYGCQAALTLTTIVIEKLVDLVAASLIVMSLLSLAFAPAWLFESASSLFLISLILGAGLILVWQLRDRIGQELRRALAPKRILPEPWSERFLQASQQALEALGRLSYWPSLAFMGAWTIIIWLLSWLTMVALLAAFGLELPLTAAIVLMLATSVSNLAPSPPALIGVMPGIAVVVLGQYGIPQAVSFGFGLVLNLVIVGPLIILGSATLSSLRWSKSQVPGEAGTQLKPGTELMGFGKLSKPYSKMGTDSVMFEE